MTEVSIIVPVYNVEQYLARCLESIISQTFKDIEIICVNDGSTDSSAKILEEYAGKDKRIKIITQTNKGLFSARHTGLKNASGQYVLFVDSDDWIDETLIEKAVSGIKKYNTDVVVFGAYSVKGHMATKGMYSVEKISSKYKEKILTLKDYENDLFCLPPTAWNKLYKKELLDINNIKFQEIRNGEDQLFYLHMILTAKNIFVLNENLYYYVKNRPGSITSNNRKTTDAPIANLYIAEQLLEKLALKEKFITQIVNKYFNKSLSWYGKCDKNFKNNFLENITKLKNHLDLECPNGWWKYFKLNEGDNYISIKIKIFLAKIKWNLMKAENV